MADDGRPELEIVPVFGELVDGRSQEATAYAVRMRRGYESPNMLETHHDGTHALQKRMWSSGSLLRKSAAAFLTDARLARLTSKKMGSCPVSALREAMAASAFCLLRAAR